MKNENFKQIQIPISAYEILKEYCKMNGLVMGRFVEKLINNNCGVSIKKLTPQRKILKVD